MRQVLESRLADVLRKPSGARYPLSDIEFLPVVPDPGKIFCLGINYHAHGVEANKSAAAHPALFVRFADSFVGHESSIQRPRDSDQFDYEGELAVVIGRHASRVVAREALSYVAGYTCCAENSVRDFQKHSTQATAGKNFRRSGSLGPWITTADEISDPATLQLTTRLNGKTMQQASLADLIFSVPVLIEYITRFTDLSPGDIISTGTPAGVGVTRDPPVYMQPGDTLEVEIDRIGCLRNRVIADLQETTPEKQQ
ncbi:MAG: fumarylacetoacetate hydrolase family protein [Planctomycetia bacterium]|nr:fumarylacetoacetate hydrolase family protein [Planctomycetia bacterium]